MKAAQRTIVRVGAQADQRQRLVLVRVDLVDESVLSLVNATLSLEAAETLHRDLGMAIGRLRIPAKVKR